MPNIIDNILPTKKVVTTNTSSTTEQTQKDKPSLFDSLLSNNTPKKESKSEVTIPTTQEVQEQTTVVLNNTEINEESVDITAKETENKEQKVPTSSLLDRLILEAKKGVKESTETKVVENEIKIKPDISMIKTEKNSILGDKKISDETLSTPKIGDTKDVLIPETNDKLGNISSKVALDVITPEIKDENSKIINKNINDKLENISSKVALDVIIPEIKDENSKTINGKINNKMVNIPKKVDSEIIVDTNISTEKEVNLGKDSDIKDIINNDGKIISIINPDSLVNKINAKTQEKLPKEEINLEVKLKNIVNIDKLSTPTTLANVITEKNKTLVEKEPVNTNIILNENLENNIIKDNSIPIEEIVGESDKKEINVIDTKKDEKISLMDQLILKNSTKLSLNMTNNNIDVSQKEVENKDFISSMYLGSQKNKINNQSLFNKNEAVNLLKDGSSIDAVKTSAEMLDLGLESIDVDKNVEIKNIDVKKSNIDVENRKNLIDNILLDKNIKSDDIKGLITKSVEASNALLDNSINLSDDATINVNSPLAFNIQSKIIGAKQQMATMMSDIAKQMYENYKPPVTAFRINLNPTTLGSIAILMKSDKNNGLTISMNVSNNTTLDSLIENQNMLKTSLNKSFDENTRFNLDFNSSNQNNGNQSSNNQNNQSNNRKFEQQMDTQSVLQLKEENKDREEKSIDYM